MNTVWKGVFLAATGILVLSCSLFGPTGQGGPEKLQSPTPVSAQEATPHTQTADPADPEQVLLEFGRDLDQIETDFVAIEDAIALNPSGAQEAALAHLGSDDQILRFAALYTVVRTAEGGEALDALLPFLESADTTERILTAQALLAQGEKAALPVLIGALDSPEYIHLWHPPLQAWEAAQFALLQYTEEDLGLVGTESLDRSAAAKRAWLEWWVEHQDTLVWDEARGVFRSANP